MAEPVAHLDDFVVRLDRARVVHGRHVALDDVSLRVRRGEFVCILGPNGSGKTTLLTAINGLARVAGGRCEVLGAPGSWWNRARTRRRIGYVAQVERVDPKLPILAWESVLAGSMSGSGNTVRPSSADREEAMRALDWVEIGSLAQRPLGHLSGGEYQRVAIARALAQRPELFLFDEPTNSLDPRAQEEVTDLIGRLHQRLGVTILMVTHDLDRIPAGCNRVLLLKQGRVWADGAPEEMLRPGRVRELFGCSAQAPAAALRSS
jgi:ABC-type Mn2+/Zn2+ transport system ATPase subunit